MASTPTTKSQVQAYRFVLRRMESALVRKDAVMLHDPMGSHKRATVVGIVLAAIGLIGFLVWGLFGGKGNVPEPGSIVIAKESGSVFVVTADDKAQKRLIPMLNMASAKLLVMAQGGGQGGPPQPTTVKEAALAEFPRGPRTGMVNAPTYLPDAKNGALPAWAICDVGDVKNTLNAASIESSTKIETTVIGGDANHGTPLAPEQSLYVKDQTSGDEYLVYRVEGIPNQVHTQAVKAKVDSSDKVIADIFGLQGKTPRTISTNMLNAIPSVPQLNIPDVPNEGDPVSYNMPQGKVGDVVKRDIPDQPDQYFVLLSEGKQQISAGAAALLHASNSSSREIPDRTGAITDAQDAPTSAYLKLDTFPMAVSKPVSFQESDTSCLSWQNINNEHHVTVTLNQGSPAAKAPVKLAQHDGNGPKVDYFYMPAGKAAVIRGAANEAGDSGPIVLVSDQGVTYGIKDVATAQGLGVIGSVFDLRDGPSWLLRGNPPTLPTGDFLDPAQASFVYDSIPVPPGAVNRPPPPKQQAATGGS
ncbi:type VII secretion protein EccB [Saccharopolyspora taberi]|uniref:Type VII secretion protein EccB n=1 Tax=Saccharopolyspora taberi TaxID=60895 RepID=A0ABN3VLP9_9PSEU